MSNSYGRVPDLPDRRDHLNAAPVEQLAKPEPEPGEGCRVSGFPFEQQIGGHAVVAVGYDDSTRRFPVPNSWGAGWGTQAGLFALPCVRDAVEPGVRRLDDPAGHRAVAPFRRRLT